MPPKKKAVDLKTQGVKTGTLQTFKADQKTKRIRVAWFKDGRDAWLEIDCQADGKPGIKKTKNVSYWLASSTAEKGSRIARNEVDWSTFYDGGGYSKQWLDRVLPSYEQTFPGHLKKRRAEALAPEKQHKKPRTDAQESSKDVSTPTTKKSFPQTVHEELMLMSKFEAKGRSLDCEELEFVARLLEKRENTSCRPPVGIVKAMKKHTITGQKPYEAWEWQDFIEQHGPRSDPEYHGIEEHSPGSDPGHRNIEEHSPVSDPRHHSMESDEDVYAAGWIEEWLEMGEETKSLLQKFMETGR